jgi:glycosyltransferase involved in cell wall biosynthesis
VVTELLHAIELTPGDRLVLFRYDHEAPESDLSLPEGTSWEVVSLGAPPARPLVRAVLGTLRRGSRLDVSEHRLNVFIQPDAANGLPTGAPVVTIAYDLIPLVFAAHCQQRMSLGALRRLGAGSLIREWLRARHYRWQLRQLTRADRVIAISDATRRDLLRYLPALPPDRISVTLLAANAAYAPSEQRGAHRRYGVSKPYLLYAGGVDVRKNVDGLVDAFHQLRSVEDCQLVLVGQDFVTFDAIEQRTLRQRLDDSPYATDILRPGYVPTDELVQLYSGAVAFVFPSLYEGFGLPVLEAMASGCPVVTYRNSSLPEVTGEAALLLNEQDDLASALREVFSDGARREQMRAAGLKQAARFSWPGTVGQMMTAVRSAAGHAD